MLLTRLPLYSQGCPRFLVRLACVTHAASVDSEPGSNSPIFFEECPRLWFNVQAFYFWFFLKVLGFGHALSSFQRSADPVLRSGWSREATFLPLSWPLVGGSPPQEGNQLFAVLLKIGIGAESWICKLFAKELFLRGIEEQPRAGTRGASMLIRRRPTLPHRCQCSTIGAGGLNFRVRDGNGCDPSATVTGNPIYRQSQSGQKSSAGRFRPRDFKQGKFYGQASRPISTGKLHALLRFHTQPITWWSSRGL